VGEKGEGRKKPFCRKGAAFQEERASKERHLEKEVCMKVWGRFTQEESAREEGAEGFRRNRCREKARRGGGGGKTRLRAKRTENGKGW